MEEKAKTRTVRKAKAEAESEAEETETGKRTKSQGLADVAIDIAQSLRDLVEEVRRGRAETKAGLRRVAEALEDMGPVWGTYQVDSGESESESEVGTVDAEELDQEIEGLLGDMSVEELEELKRKRKRDERVEEVEEVEEVEKEVEEVEDEEPVNKKTRVE